MRLLGMLTLVFAGSFAAAALTIEWPSSPDHARIAALRDQR
jgi:hypothetical protein